MALKNRSSLGDLHPEFGPWKTIHKRFLQWAKLEVWDHTLRILSINANSETVIIDAPFIKLHQTVPARGHFNQEIGRSKGGLTTKIHAVVDALGNPLRIHLTAGNVNDTVPACGLLEDLLADRAYDANKLLALAERQNHDVVIPLTPRRLEQREYDIHVYKECHLVECFFAKLKLLRIIVTRYDKLAVTFKASVILTAYLVWLQ